MCLGIGAALGLAISAASAVAGYQAQNVQYKAQKQQMQANNENAKTAAHDRYRSINARVSQEQHAESQKLQQADREAMSARSTARTAAAEGGITGVSLGSLLSDYYRRQAEFETAVQTNFDYSREYWTGEGAATRATGQNQINSITPPTKPSFFGSALKIFGQAVNEFATA